MAKKQISILIVDDSAFMRKALKRMLSSDPAIRVAGLARDGEEALQLIQTCRPDVVTLDVKMPGMDGITVLRRIMEERPTPVLMVSSLTSDGGEITLKALELGAVDFIDKSSVHTHMDILEIADALLQKVKAISGIDLSKLSKIRETTTAIPAPQRSLVRHPPTSAPTAPGDAVREGQPELLTAIGASTGGPMSLDRVLSEIPAEFPGTILVVQHMPVGFTASFAERLNAHCRLHVKEAEEDDTLRPGSVYVGPSGYHLNIRQVNDRWRIELTKYPEDTKHCPSVDVMFGSVARHWHGPVLGIVMTGMGDDGSEGVKRLKARQATILAQSEETCVVYGMPKAAWQTGCVDRLVPLPNLQREIVQFGERYSSKH